MSLHQLYWLVRGWSVQLSARKTRLIVVMGLASAVLALSVIYAEQHEDTRKSLISERRLIRSDASTTLAFKNKYFKESILAARSLGLNGMAAVAFNMNLVESRFKIPYVWGGSIKNHLGGLDCTGFIHGLMYYSGYPHYQRRFNTLAVYFKFLRDKSWDTVYHSTVDVQKSFSAMNLALGDIIVWPSNVDDGRNIPGPIWGHIGIVTLKNQHQVLVTHYVESDAYNDLDVIGTPGAGINTMDAQQFIDLKQRGVLAVFRERRR